MTPRAQPDMGGLRPPSRCTSTELPAISRLSSLVNQQPSRFETPSLADAQRHLRAQDDSIALRVPEPGTFRGYREASLPPIFRVGLSLGCIDAAVGYELSFRSGSEMLVNIPLQGSGTVTGGGAGVELGAGQILLVGPHCEVTKRWRGPGRVMSIHVPLNLLDSALGRGDPPGELPRYLPPIAQLDHAHLSTMLEFVEFLVRHGRQGGGFATSTALASQAEGMLLALLVEGLKPGLTAPASETAPYYVRRAEAFMHANLQAEVDIAQLAGAAKVSERTLQYGFRKVYARSPMQHLKLLRLELAHRLLADAEGPARRIGDVAASAGFTCLSQFCRDYKRRFGESPSATLQGLNRLLREAPSTVNHAHP